MNTPSMDTTLLQRRWLTNSTFVLHLAKPTGFTFQPGQRLHVGQGARERAYSLVSAPADTNLEILIRRIAGGKVSPLLAEFPEGQSLPISGPAGYFTFQSPGHGPHEVQSPPAAPKRVSVFVATGTGIAPFVSMARSGIRGFQLLHGVRSSTDLYFRDVLASAAITYQPCVSGPGAAHALPGAYAGRVTQFVSNNMPPGGYDFYACGRSEMIRDLAHILDNRFPQARLFTESFT